ARRGGAHPAPGDGCNSPPFCPRTAGGDAGVCRAQGYSATNSLTQLRGYALRPIGEDARTRLIMPLSIKICGLRSPQALDVALDSGADLVGFVFFAPSPRHLGLEAARTLGQRVQGRAGKVALTVDANDDTMLDIVAALKPDMLQLHGSETP